MKGKLIVLAALILAGSAACGPDLHGIWPKPILAAHQSVPADGDGLAAELALGKKNFSALEEFHLGYGEAGFPRKFQKVHELSAEEGAWSDAAVAEESRALAALIPLMERALKSPVPAEDRPLPEAPFISLGIYTVLDGPWSLAQARAELAGSLSYLHGLRRSLAATKEQQAKAEEWAAARREELAKQEARPPRRRR